MMIETAVYKLLSQDAELNDLMDELRGGKFPGDFKQGIFTYDIPETPTNYKKSEFAPFMRLNALYENESHYSDDMAIADEQRVKIEFWCQSASQSDKMKQKIDEILKNAGYERYTANENPRYKDTDIGLVMNIRKYRYFDWK